MWAVVSPWGGRYLRRFGAHTRARFRACMLVLLLNEAMWARCRIRYSKVLKEFICLSDFWQSKKCQCLRGVCHLEVISKLGLQIFYVTNFEGRLGRDQDG